jgi:large subunit ribosomal protein L17
MAPHRRAMMSNMASSLILNKRIKTTLQKAKALRKYVEPMITKSKDNTTHNRRIVFSKLQNKESIKELFDIIAQKVGERPGGYTRIIKIGNRLGDNAEMAIIELVDFNEIYTSSKVAPAKKTRRSRRSKSEGSQNSEKSVENVVAQETETIASTDAKVETNINVEQEVIEEVVTEVSENIVDETSSESNNDEASEEEKKED